MVTLTDQEQTIVTAMIIHELTTGNLAMFGTKEELQPLYEKLIDAELEKRFGNK